MLLQKPNLRAHFLEDNYCPHSSEHSGNGGYDLRTEEEVALDKADAHDRGEKMQDTSLYKGNYTMNDR